MTEPPALTPVTNTPPDFSERGLWRTIATLVWLAVLACAGGVAYWYGRDFLNADSMETIWHDAFPVLMLVGPMAVIMLGGGLDLSTGAVIALASVLTATALADGRSPQDAFLLAMLFAGGIGLTHALLAALMAINTAVVTFVTAILIHQLALMFACDLQQIPFGDSPGFIESLYCSPILLGICVGLSCILIQLAMIGGEAGRLPVARQKWHRRLLFVSPPYLLSSLAAGVVGSALAANSSEGSPEANQTTVIMVLLAALVGGNCTGRRFGTVIGAVTGAAILTALKYVMLMEAITSEMRLMILAGSAGAALILSQTAYWIINLIYRNTRPESPPTV